MPTLALNVVLNNPYPPVNPKQKVYYTSFTEQPKTLDPAKSYSANEYVFIGQIYEPPLQYDYFTRPYTLVPSAATTLPEITRYDADGAVLPVSSDKAVAKTVYTIHIKPGILYQPHPAFAMNNEGHYYYHSLPADYVDRYGVKQVSDFKHTGFRELVADDYVYQIKRLANPQVNSPIYSLMGEHLEGFTNYKTTLPSQTGYLDLREYPLQGVRVVDRYTYEITVKGEYAQFLFWLAMPFFSPIPWEVDRFYSQPGFEAHNINLSWYPVGTGPFMMTENNPNSRMTLEKNPNYREVYFPSGGDAIDKQMGYVAHAGERLPLIDKVEFVLEKESIPHWNKFLQGYYDITGIGADSFDQVIQFAPSGSLQLTAQMRDKGMRLQESIEPSVFYLGFNMLDPLVGGYSERARKLRQAIAIVVNFEEYISIFYNGRGEPAQGPIPPGIFGFQEGEKGGNSHVFTWIDGQRKRRNVSEAAALLEAAGYPHGVDPATQSPLILNYDVPSMGSPDEKAQLNWMVKQFATIGIQLNVRPIRFNQFQDKLRHGNAQLFMLGWNADYPDPENFLMLLYGPNSMVKYGGENTTNYSNARFDALFAQMKNRPNDAKRLALIQEMVDIVRYDAPWAGGLNVKVPVLRQAWVSPTKPNSIAQNAVKYVDVDVPLRDRLRQQWNNAIVWPLGVLLLGFLVSIAPFAWVYYRSQRLPVNRVDE